MIEAMVALLAVFALLAVYLWVVRRAVDKSEDFRLPYGVCLYKSGETPKASGEYVEVDMYGLAQGPVVSHMVDENLEPLPKVSKVGRFWRRIGPFQEEFDLRLLED